MLAIAKDYEKQPVVFIAVNSGTRPEAVEAYARSNKVTCPVIVDADRRFEKTCGISPEISLQNIHQLRYVTGSGTFNQGRSDDVRSAFESAAEGAKWRIAPEHVPAALKTTWRQIELGQFAKATAALNKALASKDADVKAAAEKLTASVETAFNSDVAQAMALEDEGKLWQAYQQYTAVAAKYVGFKPKAAYKDPAEAQKNLAAEAAVKAELEAQKILDSQRPLVTSASAAAQKKAVEALKKLLQTHTQTEAAKEARTLVSGR